MQDMNLDIADIKSFTLINWQKIVGCFCAGMQHVLRLREFCQLSAGGDVVGVNMRVDHITNIHATDPPYGTERSYNGLRLANSLAKNDGTSVSVFLMGDAASCAVAGQTTLNAC
jgi:hypothetical protein